MNIKDRITFIKAGYTKDEINEIIREEMEAPASSDQPAEPKPEETKAEDFMKVISALADEVKSLKKAVQVENIENTKIVGNDAQSEVDRILQSVINPNINKEEN